MEDKKTSSAQVLTDLETQYKLAMCYHYAEKKAKKHGAYILCLQNMVTK